MATHFTCMGHHLWMTTHGLPLAKQYPVLVNCKTNAIYINNNVFHLLILQGISGLQNCVQLKKIYIYDNHICEINNLELLINLEVLWLNHNCITQIQVCTIHYELSVCLCSIVLPCLSGMCGCLFFYRAWTCFKTSKN